MLSRNMRVIALLLVSALLLPMATGCEKRSAEPNEDNALRSEELTPGEFPDKIPFDPVEPPPPMLRDPKTAVYSYLIWISYAYRILNSEVATHAFDVWEEVRVNSYVELNRQEGRAIDQRLIKFEPTLVKSEGSTATVSVREEWVYRYISIADGTYSSKPLAVSYDSTYTVVNTDNKGWLVHKVEAIAVGATPE